MQDFHHIQAWQRAHALSVALHKMAIAFSRKGHGHLRSQLTRAVDGIESNIVEGCGAATNKEFARYLDVSVKSANEPEVRLLTARDLSLITHAAWEGYSGETVEIRKMIYAYRKKVLQSDRGS